MEKQQITITVPRINLHNAWRFAQKWLLPNPGTLVLMLVLLLTVPTLAGTLQGINATSISTIPYQGRLADASGNPVTGKQNMEFRIYDVPADGTPLWEEFWTGANSVDVSDGLFSVMLGSINTGLTAVVQGNNSLYLGITVGTDSEMTPRVQLGSVPFSIWSLTMADESVTTEKIADGAVTAEKLAFSTSRLLGEKSCNGCDEPTETNPTPNWVSFKGADLQDVMEVDVTTQGGPVMAYITGRYEILPGGQSESICGIYVYQNGTQVRRAVLDGVYTTLVKNFSCSGGYLFTDLPAGTYTFTAKAYALPGDIKWERNRQIVVFEY